MASTPVPRSSQSTPAADAQVSASGGDTMGMSPSSEPASRPLLEPPQATDELGRLGPYRVLKLLGEGGMGYVYLAEDSVLQRPVALKVMKTEVAAKSVAKDRFLREGRAAAKLKSDHIVTIHFVGEANGVPFMALEFLEGASLEDWLRSRQSGITLPILLKVARDVLKGLAAAHEKGLVHCDIKPANLWVEKSTQRIKVLDFGLTRDAGGQDQVTQEGAVVGTPAYMAPEQASGAQVDARVDLFSLGVVLHRMVSGKSPFQRGEVMATLMALALDQPSDLSSISAIPKPVADFVARLLSKDPAGRPKDAKAALAELQAIEKSLKGTSTSGPMPVIVSVAPAASISRDATEVGNPWEDIDASAASASVVPVPGVRDAAPVSVEATNVEIAAPARSRKPLWYAAGGLAVLAAAVLVVAISGPGRTPTAAVPSDNQGIASPQGPTPGSPLIGGTTKLTPGNYALRFDRSTSIEVPTLVEPPGMAFTIEAYVSPENSADLRGKFGRILSFPVRQSPVQRGLLGLDQKATPGLGSPARNSHET